MAVYTAIDNPGLHFQTKLYTGNNSTNAITLDGSENMQPDMVWLKSRSATTDHAIFDAVRGVTKEIRPNKTDYEDTASNGLTAFGTDGFTIGDWFVVNASSATFLSWNWKAGGSGSTNNDGSTASTVSANTTAGFSIVKHSGSGGATTIGHGLGVAPTIVLTKRLNSANAWIFQQNIIGGSFTNSNYLIFNTSAAVASGSGIVNNVTSSTISFAGADDWVNASGSTYIHYVFAEKQGYSKFSSYKGNGNADGAFVYTGFKPAMIISKKTSGTSDWIIWDNKRDGYNETLKRVYPNDPANEESSATQGVDFLSNGFKLRGTNSNAWNASGGNYIYMAFAESPFVNSNGVPNNAR